MTPQDHCQMARKTNVPRRKVREASGQLSSCLTGLPDCGVPPHLGNCIGQLHGPGLFFDWLQREGQRPDLLKKPENK